MDQLIVALDARLAGTDSTGDATYWRGLIQGLAEAGTSTYLLYSNRPKPEWVPDDSKLVWKHLPGGGRLWSLVRFPLAARRDGADLIHTQYNLSPLAGRKGITTVHDVSFRIEPNWFRPKDRFLLSRFVGSSIRRSRRVMTVSQASKTDLLRFYPEAEGKTDVAPLACGFGVQAVPPDEAVEIVSELMGEQPYVLTVGSRWPRKNIGLAIESVQLLPEDIPHRLAVSGKAGWGGEQEGTRSKRLGYVDDRTLSALYQCASAYLAPSFYEGFGLTLLEAFAMGCPVLCSPASAHIEVASGAALVAESWDPAHWAASLSSLLRDSSKLAEMKRLGAERAKEFDWKETARLTDASYKEAAT